MPASALTRILDQKLITPAFQPLVDLYTGETLGYEALARGPVGPLQRPDVLFATARREGLLFELDRACRAAAVGAAHAAGLRAPSTLFVNIEPDAVDMSGAGAAPELSRLPEGIRLVVEITERALTARPADLLPLVEELRAHGIGVALDDVGVDPRSLALMPFLRPDVIKLDLQLTQERPSRQVAEVHNAVSAHAERTSAVIVAEGIETEQHAERARAMGASVGQGWLFAHPGPLPADRVEPKAAIAIAGSPLGDVAQTPFRSIEGLRPRRRGTKRLVLEISRELERQAQSMGRHAVLLSTFQRKRHFNRMQAELYGELAQSLAFVGAIGQGITPCPVMGVRGANIEAGDPLIDEWDIVVLAPHFGAAFTALDLGDTGGEDLARRFDFQLTHDRELVIRAARALMSRIEPLQRPAAERALSVAL